MSTTVALDTLLPGIYHYRLEPATIAWNLPLSSESSRCRLGPAIESEYLKTAAP